MIEAAKDQKNKNESVNPEAFLKRKFLFESEGDIDQATE
jgi:hypothetical protein